MTVWFRVQDRAPHASLGISPNIESHKWVLIKCGPKTKNKFVKVVAPVDVFIILRLKPKLIIAAKDRMSMVHWYYSE